MTVQVDNFVVHYVDKHEDKTEIHLRNDEMPINEKVHVFIEQLHHAYNAKPGKGFCGFSAEKNGKVAAALESYHTGNLHFYNFSTEATSVLQEELNKYAFDETGYLVFCHYKYVADNYLLIALINVKEHYSINQELDLTASRHLDITRMQLAVRIDLNGYQIAREDNRYISFIKGRAGRKVADFFLDFLGCEEGIDAKKQSQAMLMAVEDYLSAAEYQKDEKNELRKQVFDYCNDCVSSGSDASVMALSKTISQESARPFEDFYQEQNYGLEESFPVDKKTVSSMVKFSGVGGGVSVSFERKHLGERVVYNPVTDTLTIKGIPANLKDQLTRFLDDAE